VMPAVRAVLAGACGIRGCVSRERKETT